MYLKEERQSKEEVERQKEKDSKTERETETRRKVLRYLPPWTSGLPSLRTHPHSELCLFPVQGPLNRSLFTPESLTEMDGWEGIIF